MTLNWERRKILIWGKTRPELSKTYREIVCTGGVFEDTRRLVRLYPIPLRYLDDEKIFKKYQWIEADVARNLRDPRPESYKVRFEGIEIGGWIPTRNGNWDARAEWILHPDNLFQSVEALQERQQADNTSLGLVTPAEVTDIKAHRISQAERDQFAERYREAVSQMELPLDEEGRVIRPLRMADYRFKIHFRCEDEHCTGHVFGILDWEIDALYSRLRSSDGRSHQEAAEGVLQKLREFCGDPKDTRFFLGNIANHPQNFTIVGLWYPKKKPVDPQGSLF